MTVTHDQIIEALDALDEARAQLPTRCPRWCVANHVQALEEGCTVDEARDHISVDYAGKGTPGGGYRVQMTSDPRYNRGRIDLELVRWSPESDGEDRRLEHLTVTISTSEARTLSAYLLHLADEGELH